MKKFLLLFAFLFAVSTSANAEIIKTSNPETYAKKLSEEVQRIVGLDVEKKDRQKLLKSLFKDNVDTNFMGKFALGKYYRTLNEEQKDNYLKLYRDYVMYSYIPKFEDYASGEVKILSALKKDKGEYVVKTKLNPKASDIKDINLDYRIKKKGNSFIINDIIGEGVSYITTQRSDFGGALSKISVESFIGKLEKKVNKLKAK